MNWNLNRFYICWFSCSAGNVWPRALLRCTLILKLNSADFPFSLVDKIVLLWLKTFNRPLVPCCGQTAVRCCHAVRPRLRLCRWRCCFTVLSSSLAQKNFLLNTPPKQMLISIWSSLWGVWFKNPSRFGSVLHICKISLYLIERGQQKGTDTGRMKNELGSCRHDHGCSSLVFDTAQWWWGVQEPLIYTL